MTNKERLKELVPGIKAEDYDVTHLNIMTLLMFLAARDVNNAFQYDVLSFQDIFNAEDTFKESYSWNPLIDEIENDVVYADSIGTITYQFHMLPAGFGRTLSYDVKATEIAKMTSDEIIAKITKSFEEAVMSNIYNSAVNTKLVEFMMKHVAKSNGTSNQIMIYDRPDFYNIIESWTDSSSFSIIESASSVPYFGSTSGEKGTLMKTLQSKVAASSSEIIRGIKYSIIERYYNIYKAIVDEILNLSVDQNMDNQAAPNGEINAAQPVMKNVEEAAPVDLVWKEIKPAFYDTEEPEQQMPQPNMSQQIPVQPVTPQAVPQAEQAASSDEAYNSLNDEEKSIVDTIVSSLVNMAKTPPHELMDQAKKRAKELGIKIPNLKNEEKPQSVKLAEELYGDPNCTCHN